MELDDLAGLDAELGSVEPYPLDLLDSRSEVEPAGGGSVQALRRVRNTFPVDSLLAPIFKGFEQSGVRWCLLDVPGAGSASSSGVSRAEEVAALVDRPALGTASRILQDAGFVARSVHAIDHGSVGSQPPIGGVQARFVGYNADTDRWVTLDLATRLAYGPEGSLETGAERGVLERRQWEGGVFVPAPDDAFWILMLRLMLEDSIAAGPLWSRLERLVSESRPDGPLGRLVAEHLPPRWTPSHLIDCVWEGDYRVVGRLAEPFEEHWFRSRTWAARRRALANRVALRLFERRLAPPPRGLSVALLGPNSTLKVALGSDLGSNFYLPVTYVRMGALPRSRRGRLVRAGFLRTLGTQWRRYVLGRMRRGKGRLVVFDRYTYDWRLPPAATPGSFGRLRRSLLGRGCPAPDLVLILDLPPGKPLREGTGPLNLPALRGRRAARAAAQASLRQHYLDLSLALPDAIVVDTGIGRDAVRREVTSQVWKAYATAPQSAGRRLAARLRNG